MKSTQLRIGAGGYAKGIVWWMAPHKQRAEGPIE